MRRILFLAAFAGLFFGSGQASNAQAFRTGPEANKYLFMFYAIDDMVREFSLAEIEAIKKNSEATIYADRLGAIYTKRRMILNSFRRHADIIKLDKQCYDGIEEANGLLKFVGDYYTKLKEAQNTYDLGFRAIQAKLFTDAELKDKLLQSFVDAESYYLKNMEGRKSEYALGGITRSMKRRAVAEYQVAKNKQKLAEDVHAACLKYEAENRPALEGKIDSIHHDFAADFETVHRKACESIAAKFKPLASKMEVSEAQIYLIAARKEFDWANDGKDRPRDPFRLISAARKTKIETAADAKAAHEFARECIKAIEWIPDGDLRDTTEVFFYYRGLLSGWAATLATKAAEVHHGSESLAKASPNEVAATATYAWSCYKTYERSGAFPKSHFIVNHVMAKAYSGQIQDALKIAKDSAGERIDDPNYWYVLSRLCGIYKFGSKKDIENQYDLAVQFMREAMLLGFTGVEEAKISTDFDKIRSNPKFATKLNQAMFEPDNLFKLTKVSQAARKN
jgi:hypothetical protein